jgi:flagellar biosynthetic protein FliQ
MNPQDAIDLSREAIKACMMVGGPILIISLLIGLLVGVFQAMTQVQDQTVSFVPKILLLIVAIGACLPWLTEQMTDFARHSFERPFTQSSFAMPTTRPSAPAKMETVSFSKSLANAFAPLFEEESTSSPFEPTLTDASAMGLPQTMPNSQSAKPPQDDTELKSPFMLPHYRFSRAPKPEIGG